MKRLLFLLLSCCAIGAQAGYTPPLEVTEVSGNRLLEPGNSQDVTYTVHSNINTQAIHFSITLPSGMQLLPQGFTCGPMDDPQVSSKSNGGKCQFRVRVSVSSSEAAGSKTFQLQIEHDDTTDRGGSSNPFVSHNTIFSVLPVNALQFNGPFFQERTAGDNTLITFTLTNNSTVTISGISVSNTITNNPVDAIISAGVNNCGSTVTLNSGASCTMNFSTNTIGSNDYNSASVYVTASHPGGFHAESNAFVQVAPKQTQWVQAVNGQIPLTGLFDMYTPDGTMLALLNGTTISRVVDATQESATVQNISFNDVFYPLSISGVGNEIFAGGFLIGLVDSCAGCGPIPHQSILRNTDFTTSDDFVDYSVNIDGDDGVNSEILRFAVGEAGGGKALMSLYDYTRGFLLSSDPSNVQNFIASAFSLDAFAVALAIDSEISGSIHRGFVAYDGAIQFTTDELGAADFGQQWNSTHGAIPIRVSAGEFITAMAVLNANPNTPYAPTDIYVATNRAVYRSLDTGASWSMIIDNHNVSSLAVARGDGVSFDVDKQFLYIGTHGQGMIRCDDVTNPANTACVFMNDGTGTAPLASADVLKVISNGVFPENHVFVATTPENLQTPVSIFYATNS